MRSQTFLGITAFFYITYKNTHTLPKVSMTWCCIQRCPWRSYVPVCVCVCTQRGSSGRRPELVWSQGPLVINNKDSEPGRTRDAGYDWQTERERDSDCTLCHFPPWVPTAGIWLIDLCHSLFTSEWRLISQGRGCSDLCLQSIMDTAWGKKEISHPVSNGMRHLHLSGSWYRE